jgi:hypothetical protein
MSHRNQKASTDQSACWLGAAFIVFVIFMMGLFGGEGKTQTDEEIIDEYAKQQAQQAIREAYGR